MSNGGMRGQEPIIDSGLWKVMDVFMGLPGPIVATGGTIVSATINGVGYQYHIYKSGTSVFEVISGKGLVEYLVVGGGGGGRESGSGAGGLLSGSLTVRPGRYAVEVGSGGGTGDVPTATKGGNSVFASVIAFGGGKGGYTPIGDSHNGGSGGGVGGFGAVPGTGIAGQGFAGGDAPNGGSQGRPTGGGGGAGAVGGNGSGANADSRGGNGGAGLAIPMITTTISSANAIGQISGSNVFFSGGGAGIGAIGASGGIGGGGAGRFDYTTAAHAIANTGGGGGSGTTGAGLGGSGVVVIRYPS